MEPTAASHTMTGRELLFGSAFHPASGGEGGAPAVAAWGRVATGSFDADMDDVTMDGEVTTAFLGAVGGRGTLLVPEEAGGFELALKSDALLVQMSSQAAQGMEASVADSRAFEVGGVSTRSSATGSAGGTASASSPPLRCSPMSMPSLQVWCAFLV